MRKTLPLMVLYLMLVFGLINCGEAVQYQMTLLDTFIDGGYSRALGINGRGQVVGESALGDGTTHACLWDVDGSIKDLGTLAGGGSTAKCINDLGQIVGSSTAPDGISQAFLWQNGTMAGLNGSVANSINDNGQVTGSTNSGAFAWGNGKYYDLGSGSAFAISASGNAIVGMGENSVPKTWNYDPGRDVWHSFTLDVPFPGYGAAYGISQYEVVGFAGMHAAIWDSPTGGNRHDLGTFGGDVSWANAINLCGQVVGYAYTSDGCSHAFIWQGGELIALDELDGSDRSAAYAINEFGEIAGIVYIDGLARAALWKPASDPVPEPCSACLMFTGFWGVAFWRRRYSNNTTP